MSTPEGRVKAKLDKVLKSLDVWRYSPQAGPFGGSGVPDRLVLARGQLIGIECKADGTKKPTRLQEISMQQIAAHGGVCFLVYDEDTIQAVKSYIEQVLGSR